MRKGMFLGEHVLLSDREWKNCLKRVDVTRVKTELGKYVIYIKCPFCEAEARECDKCPLDVYRLEGSVASNDWGCVRLFKLVATELGIDGYPGLYDDFVSWDIEEPENRQCRQVLKFVHEGLLKLEKTKERRDK